MRKTLGMRVNDAMIELLAIEHRVDPYFRDTFNALLQRPIAEVAQLLLRLTHANPETRLCQEIIVPGEEEFVKSIVHQMSSFTEREYAGRTAERAGNTKTYGIVEAEFTVKPDLPAALRKGVFASPATFPAWIRFGGPGPQWPPDVKDAGILSIGIKLMGVPGAKLLPDETATQDFLGITCPTFTTPNVTENAKLQRQINAGTPIFYFLNPFDSHYLDAVMQGVYSRMNRNPLEARYWSCVPYLLGAGQAMKYSIRPTHPGRTRIPWKIPDDWLRQALTGTLQDRGATLEFSIQVQTDYRRMPIEDASIEWPERLSPFIPVATVTIPRQKVDAPERTPLARKLSFNPWHSIEEHRPLGNQNRARKAIYSELSRLRQSLNREPHVEPKAT